ncbi:hypothetical protein [Nitratireductor sp. ZSWI3]|uniref:hypothetical protein n=1 Tax=Nitratireductor sp. ZSWI3 TaxID=2966359 RepID=UPI00214FDE88|nr:hypothetical protein [Nitratireductor sp. ZSWI3]MCR4268141.1 hypothetical protein [Nitratireductor sp. ZSWI3]
MKRRPGASRIGAAFALVAGVLAAGCTTAPEDDADGAYTGPLTYRCEEDMQMTVQRKGSLVSVHSPRGIDLDLPAAPPGQSARFGESLYAVVLEGKDALWMVNGKPPISCSL